MNKELCFNIENENLYLEQVLVDYMDIPIFFLCKSKKQYYIALCTDIEELSYVVTELSLSDTYNLLHEKISMRNVILKQKEFWEIISAEEIALDIVTKCKMADIDTSVLPEENACFKVLTKQIEVFVQQFDHEYFSMKYFSESDKKIVSYDVFEGDTIDILLGNIYQFTELGDYIVQNAVVSEVASYNEIMKNVKTAETILINSSEICKIELTESKVRDMAAAA